MKLPFTRPILISTMESPSGPQAYPQEQLSIKVVPSAVDEGRIVIRRRKKSSYSWTKDTPYLEDDGYSWRKYGEKEILGHKYPRNYFRFFFKIDSNCNASKQVQRIQDDPPLYRTTYIGHHICEQQSKSEQIEWLILLRSLVIEGLSAIFEQLSYALLGMVMAIAGFVICLVEMVYRARIEQAMVDWTRKLPLLYSKYPKHKPFGTTVQYFGLTAAIWQCFHACVGYYYARKNAENPIKMAITMFLFCICLVVSKIVNTYSTKTTETEN